MNRYELTSGADAWSASQALSSPETISLLNRGTYPVRVSFDGGTTVAARLEAAGSRGDSMSLRVKRDPRPTSIVLYGVGGASSVVVHAGALMEIENAGGGGGAIAGPALSTDTPAALGSAAVGTASTAARADHVHAHPGGSTVALALAASASAGVSTELARVDHVHPLPAGSTVALALAASASAGVSTELARVDHVHPLPAGSTVALALAASASAGVSTELARVDHAHPVGTISASLAAEGSNKRRMTLTGLGASPVYLSLHTATGALADGAAGQALDLITGTTAAWSLGSGSCVEAIITPDAGSVVVDINDKSTSLVGSVFLISRQPATGAWRVDEAAFT